MVESADIVEQFRTFLEELSTGGGDQEMWEHHVVAHYSDPTIEAARVELVRNSILAGVWDWERVPISLRQSASKLLNSTTR